MKVQMSRSSNCKKHFSKTYDQQILSNPCNFSAKSRKEKRAEIISLCLQSNWKLCSFEKNTRHNFIHCVAYCLRKKNVKSFRDKLFVLALRNFTRFGHHIDQSNYNICSRKHLVWGTKANGTLLLESLKFANVHHTYLSCHKLSDASPYSTAAETPKIAIFIARLRKTYQWFRGRFNHPRRKFRQTTISEQEDR